MSNLEQQIRAAQQTVQGIRPASPNLGQTVDIRREQIERQEAVQGQVMKVHTFILVSGSGEASVDVGFSLRFTQKPLVSFMAELDENQSPTAGSFPTVSVVVAKWKFDELDRYRKYYVGATLSVVTTGKMDQKIWIHFGAEGMALVGPSGGAFVAE